VSVDDREHRVAVQAPTWFVPPTLADLECRHGNLWDCDACELDRERAALDRELELEAVR
jgi:hypothetical protein